MSKKPMQDNDDPCMMRKTGQNQGGSLSMAKDRDAERAELSENAQLAAELKKSDANEDESWGVKTDKAAFGHKRIVIPDRWD